MSLYYNPDQSTLRGSSALKNKHVWTEMYGPSVEFTEQNVTPNSRHKHTRSKHQTNREEIYRKKKCKQTKIQYHNSQAEIANDSELQMMKKERLRKD